VTVPHAHRYWLERGGHWEYFWLVLNGREALRLAREVLALTGPVLEPGPEQVDRLAASCLMLMTTPHLTPGLASALGYAAMAALHDAAHATRDMRPALPAAIARVADHIARHLADPLPVDRLAQVAGMSRAHFVRRFAAAIGQPPSQYVQQRRLERIERLLLATEMKVAEIAAVTGFADANYLAKAFRRRHGMSPLDYRATRAEAN
jgi:AraC family transcriptional regulator